MRQACMLQELLVGSVAGGLCQLSRGKKKLEERREKKKGVGSQTPQWLAG